MSSPLLVAFGAGTSGAWRISQIETIIGDGLPPADRLAVLRGTTSNTRYSNRDEVDTLSRVQQDLSRPQATLAALIPIRKTDAWWTLAQDERRLIFEEQSRHIAIGLEYLPGVARRLHHCRELGEPF
jgi:hypothetical protein